MISVSVCSLKFLFKSLNSLLFLWQLYPYNEDAGVLISERRTDGLVASLADIAWIDRDEEDEGYFSNPRWHQHTI